MAKNTKVSWFVNYGNKRDTYSFNSIMWRMTKKGL